VRPLGTIATIRLVARRELRQRLRARSYRIGTLVIALVAAGLALLPSLLPGAGEDRWTLAVVGSAPASLERVVGEMAVTDAATVDVRRQPGGDPAALVRGDDVDAALVNGRRIVVDAQAGSDLERIVTTAAVRARLVEAVGDRSAAASARQIALQRVGESEGAEDWVVRFAGVLALFFAIATYGSWVLNSVLEEKSNRVVEIVVSTITPRRMLAGKVIGNGLAGLLQFVIVVGAGFAVAAATGALSDLPSGGAATVLATVGWFVLGFGLYAVGYAAAGALVSRQEDAQGAVTPMITVAMAAYLTSVWVVNPDPGSTAAAIVSQIPPVTPLAMPVRIGAGEAAAWEVALSIVLMLAATWLMIRLAGRIYANALLRTGARVPLRRALKGAGA
jgi:ABC-2 type transport system permease protein